MKNTKTWLDFLKLRVSWGQVGNAKHLAITVSENAYELISLIGACR